MDVKSNVETFEQQLARDQQEFQQARARELKAKMQVSQQGSRDDKKIKAGQAVRAQVLQQFPSFEQSMDTLYDAIKGSDIGSIAKFGILRHLINVINKVATYPMQANLNGDKYLIGLYQALSKCARDEIIKSLIVKRLAYSMATTTKIMASFSAVFTYTTIKNIPIPLLQWPNFENSKALLDDAIDSLQATAPIDKNVLLDASSLCQISNKPTHENTTNVQTLIESLKQTAQKSDDMYALVALSQLLSNAYQEQFKLENQVLFGQERQATPYKDILNNILQITYITNPTIGYRYLLQNVSSLKRYLLTSAAAESAPQKLKDAIKNYITAQRALFNSIIDGTTLSFLQKNSPAQPEKTHFGILYQTFITIKEDTQYEYHDYALKQFLTILGSPDTKENAQILEAQDAQSIYNNLQRRINSEFGLTISLKSFFSWRSDVDKAFIEAMEQWAIATIQKLKADQPPAPQ